MVDIVCVVIPPSFYEIETEGPVQQIHFASDDQTGSLRLRGVSEPLSEPLRFVWGIVHHFYMRNMQNNTRVLTCTLCRESVDFCTMRNDDIG
jgi:hypothetical protein